MTEIASPSNIVNDIVNARIGQRTVAPYASTVQSVIDALNSRDEAIAEYLLDEAARQELDVENKVRPVLIAAGLLPEPVAPLAAVQDDEEMPGWARALMQRMDALESKKSKKSKKS